MRGMASRRSRFEIYVDVLTEIRNGTVLPTKIMYGANMSWVTLMDALELLKAQGLVEEHMIEGSKRSRRRYTLTGKGKNVLSYFKKVKDLLVPEAAVEIPV